MASIDEVFQLTKYRASKAGYAGTIASNDFNLLFPRAGIRYFLKLYGNQNQYQYNNPVPPIAYPGTIKVSTSLSKFGTVPQIIMIDASGRWYKPVPNTDFFIDSISHYVVSTGGTSVNTFSLTAGSGYTDGIYLDKLLTGGAGSGVRANITVVAGAVTQVVLTSIGIGYAVGNVLTISLPAGSGWHITVSTLTQNEPTPVRRVEKQDLADFLYSYIDFPTEIFPIYVEYATYIQFYPENLATAQLITLRKPVTPVWGSVLTGTIVLTNNLISGSGYTNGTYTNIVVTGGAGNSAIINVTVSGGGITEVSIVDGGFSYGVGNLLSGSIPGGTGWSFKPATIVNGRQTYNAGTSVDPEWYDIDIDEIIYMTLADIGVFLKDDNLEAFATNNMKTGGIL